MTRLLRDRYLWLVVALAVLLGSLIYVAETYILGWLPPQDEWLFTYMALERILFLVAVAIAAWRFGVKGGLAVWFALGLVALPRIIDETIIAWRPDWSLEIIIVAAVGIILSWLIGTRGRVKEKFRHAAEEWRTTFDSITDLVSIHDKDFKLLRVNMAYANTFKMHPKELIGKTCYEVVHGTKEPRPDCPHVQTLETKKPVTVEYFEPRLGVHLEMSTSPIFNERGEVIASVHIAKDITERKRAEVALRESEEKYHAIFNEARDGIVLIDNEKGGIVDCNPEFERQTGRPLEQLKKMKIWELRSPDKIEAAKGKFLAIKEAGIGGSTELEFQKPDGEIVFTEFTSKRIKINNRYYLQSMVRDLTERKRAEAERHELEEKARLASRLASVGQMASGIAHEINNPLTSVIGFTELLIKKDIPDDIKQDVKIINDGAQRVSGIVKRLLTFARRHKLEREYVDINEVIETTLDLRAYELKTGNIKVTTQLAHDLPRTMADGGQLQQVFLNIIINAETEMKSAHGRGSLLVKTEAIANTICISFKDDGQGIAEENLEKIFDPFFTTRDAGQGTGLGLSVCHGIISEHNGRMYVESELGEGATFVVELPLVSEPEQPEVPEVAEPATDEVERITRARILVVDDEPAIRQFLSQVLADEGHKVETVDNASDALDRIKRKRYNIILLDIKMPDMSGIELYKRVREIAQPLAERIVFITGDVMGADTRNFFSKTKTPYITKPFDAEKLKKAINRILAEPVKS